MSIDIYDMCSRMQFHNSTFFAASVVRRWAEMDGWDVSNACQDPLRQFWPLTFIGFIGIIFLLPLLCHHCILSISCPEFCHHINWSTDSSDNWVPPSAIILHSSGAHSVSLSMLVRMPVWVVTPMPWCVVGWEMRLIWWWQCMHRNLWSQKTNHPAEYMRKDTYLTFSAKMSAYNNLVTKYFCISTNYTDI